jgi:hypothetical protein
MKKVDCRFIPKLAIAQGHLSQSRMVASMTTLGLVTAFYERIWNTCDFERQVIVELWAP